MNEQREPILAAFGKLVRQRRNALSISQEELGYRSGLDRTYISGIERGTRNPTLTALMAIAKGLGLTVSEVVQNLEQETQQSHDE